VKGNEVRKNGLTWNNSVYLGPLVGACAGVMDVKPASGGALPSQGIQNQTTTQQRVETPFAKRVTCKWLFTRAYRGQALVLIPADTSSKHTLAGGFNQSSERYVHGWMSPVALIRLGQIGGQVKPQPQVAADLATAQRAACQNQGGNQAFQSD
jgi:hypothetical protein